MSASGALIEAAALAEAGARVILKRGSLEVASVVAWRSGRRAGIAFEAAIRISDWMSRQVASHQDRVDQILSELRTESPIPSHPTVVPSQIPAGLSIEAELLVLRGDLERLGTGLITDRALIAGHPEVQLLDASVQRIGRILGQLRRVA